MKESPFKTIDEQIDILKQRNLNFIDKENCKKKLLEYGYYEIVNGFKDFLLESKNPDKFNDNETFEHLFAIYELDKHIQQGVLRATLEVELLLKTALSYTIAKRYGEKESQYIVKTNYKLGKEYIGKNGEKFYSIDNIFEKFKKILEDDSNPFKHYRDEYNNIPPWIMMKGFSFGNCIHFLKLQKADVKNEIISILTGIPKDFIENNEDFKKFVISVLNLAYRFRNRSAHCSRIYNYKPKGALLLYYASFHNYINVSKNEFDDGVGNNDLYSLYRGLNILSSSKPNTFLGSSIRFYIDEHLKLFPDDKANILKSIGVPNFDINLNIDNIL